MKCKAALLIILCTSCANPVINELAHEAAVAEQAIEIDQAKRNPPVFIAKPNPEHAAIIEQGTNNASLESSACVANHRQYPPRSNRDV